VRAPHASDAARLAGNPAQKFVHRSWNLIHVCLQRKMSCVQELHCSIWIVSAIRLSSGRNEERIVLAPYGKQRRLRFTKIRLERRIQFHVRSIVEKQIELDVCITRAFEQSLVQRIRFRRHHLRMRNAMLVLKARALQRQNVTADDFAILVDGVAQ